MAINPSRAERPDVARKFRAAARRHIVVVHGAAGCGKSTAIREHLAGLDGACAAFAVRAEHADVAAFARGLAQALATVAPAALRLLPAAFSNARRQPDPWETIALWLAGILEPPLTVAVDELQRLEDDEKTFRFLAQLVDATAPNVRWILGTRSTAALPLPRWLASGLADASIDASALRVHSREIPGLAVASGADPAFVAALHALHDGSVGAIVDGISGAHAAWRTLALHGDMLIALAALPRLDDEMLDALGPGARDLFGEIERAIPAAFTRNPDGTRDFNEGNRTRAFSIGKSHGPDTVVRGRILASRALEAAGRPAEALQLYVAARSSADVARMLDLHGFELHENGAADIVCAAIAALPDAHKRGSAIALMLEATDESYRGRYDISESWFEQALRLARNERQRLRIDVTFAVELLRRGRADAFDRLQALSAAARDDALAVTILGSLATAHATAGRLDAAKACVAQALEALPAVDDIAVVATVHQRAAYVALAAGDIGAAQVHADAAATLAADSCNDELIAIARSVSYVIAFSYKDDQAQALDALNQIAKAGARLKNALFRRFALIGSYLICAERDDGLALLGLEAQLAGEELEASLQHVEEGLLPARALASSWSGDFLGAHRVLAASTGRQPAAETRALRWAEVALYAALAALDDEAAAALAKAQREFESIGENYSVESLRAALLIAFAALVLRRISVAAALLDERAAELERWPRWRPLHAFLTTLCNPRAGTGEPEALLGLLDAMRDGGIGGWARLIASIPMERLPMPIGAW